jgi:small-conductance mechanosensitive channel
MDSDCNIHIHRNFREHPNPHKDKYNDEDIYANMDKHQDSHIDIHVYSNSNTDEKLDKYSDIYIYANKYIDRDINIYRDRNKNAFTECDTDKFSVFIEDRSI